MKVILFLLLACAFLLNSCNDENNTALDRCCTHFRILNLAEDSPSLDLFSNYVNTTNRIAVNLKPREMFPKQGYVEMDGIMPLNPDVAGTTYQWKLTETGKNLTPRAVLAETTYIFEKNKNYLVFLSDEAKNKPIFSILPENKIRTNIDTESVYFRCVELYPKRKGEISLRCGQTLTTTPASGFGGISRYVSFKASTIENYTMEALVLGNTILNRSEIELKPGKSYTFYCTEKKIGFFED